MIKRFDRDKLVSIQVYYHMPDHVHLINEFTWQTQDIIPDFPRSVKFIRYWHKNIDAVIQEAYLYHTNYWGGKEYVNLKDVYKV
jgi:uncharacterized protein Usg